MSTKDAGEANDIPVLDEDALQMPADHSCCGPVEELADTGLEETGEIGAQQLGGQDADLPGAVQEDQGANRASGLAKRIGVKNASRFTFRARLAGFLAVALAILGTALWLVRPMDMGEQAADYTVYMSMSGFTPPALNFPAGKPVTLKLVNNESPFHASGAEHQFAVDALGINEKLQAKQTRVITVPAQKPGEYTFYCDVCCGGQKSPTMRGKLTFQ